MRCFTVFSFTDFMYGALLHFHSQILRTVFYSIFIHIFYVQCFTIFTFTDFTYGALLNFHWQILCMELYYIFTYRLYVWSFTIFSFIDFMCDALLYLNLQTLSHSIWFIFHSKRIARMARSVLSDAYNASELLVQQFLFVSIRK